MRAHGWVLVLCLVLMVWRPLDFALELPHVLPSIGMRGAAGAIEILVHGAIAMVAVAAAWSLWIGVPGAPKLAAFALIASAAASVQSLYWTVLPHQTMPGDELPLAGLAMLQALGWLLYLVRSRRVRDLY